MEPTIKEIEGFLKDYEEENACGGMPLMVEEIYIKHVRFLFSHIKTLKKENRELREAIEKHHYEKTLRTQGLYHNRPLGV